MSLRLAGKLFHKSAAAFGKHRSPYVHEVVERQGDHSLTSIARKYFASAAGLAVFDMNISAMAGSASSI